MEIGICAGTVGLIFPLIQKDCNFPLNKIIVISVLTAPNAIIVASGSQV
jgi:hypothetical protein